MCALKHKKEWKAITSICSEYYMPLERIYFMLALREVEDGSKNNEFNILKVKGAGFDEQCRTAVLSTIANEKRWIKALRDQKPQTSFIQFFGLYGGPLGIGWHQNPPTSNGSKDKWIELINSKIKEIKDEFDRDQPMGAEH